MPEIMLLKELDLLRQQLVILNSSLQCVVWAVVIGTAINLALFLFLKYGGWDEEDSYR